MVRWGLSIEKAMLAKWHTEYMQCRTLTIFKVKHRLHQPHCRDHLAQSSACLGPAAVSVTQHYTIQFAEYRVLLSHSPNYSGLASSGQ